MKRDYELIRKIFLEVEENNGECLVYNNSMKLVSALLWRMPNFWTTPFMKTQMCSLVALLEMAATNA